MSNESAVKLKQLTSVVKQMSDYLKEKIDDNTTQINDNMNEKAKENSNVGLQVLSDRNVESANKFTISEYSVRNNVKQTDNSYLNWIDTGDRITGLTIEGKTLYKNGDKYQQFHDTNSAKITLESLGEAEKDSSNKYPIKLDIIDRANAATKKTITVLLNSPLRSIYDKTDVIDLINKKLYRNIQWIVLDGTQNITLKTHGTTYSSFYVTLPTDKQAEKITNEESRGACLCDSLYSLADFPNVQQAKVENEAISVSTAGDSLTLQIKNSNLSAVTADGLKAYLTSNNMKVYYQLAEPTIETITLSEDINPQLVKNRSYTIELQNTIKSMVNLEVTKVTKNPNRNYIDNYKGVKWNGRLKVENGLVCNQFGTPYQLTGMSTFHFKKKEAKLSYNAVKTTKLYGANYLRCAMYLNNAQDGSKGYLEAKEETKVILKNLVDYAIDLDMYVCVDWHGLANNLPLTNVADAKEFFTEMCTLYKNVPNVIWEIFNEPPIADDTWINQAKPYAEQIIPHIRAIIPDSFIIVGTQKTDNVWEPTIASPLTGTNANNIVYCYHLYGGKILQGYKYMASNLPMFVSEWGVGNATTETPESADYVNSEKDMLYYSKKFNLSWAMWALSNKVTAHNFVDPEVNVLQDGGWIADALSKTGKFISKHFRYSTPN